MKQVLDSLEKVEGVAGVAVFSGTECIESGMEPRYDLALLAKVIQHLESLSDFNASLADATGAGMVVARYAEGYLMARRVNDLMLLVLAHNETNQALLQVAFNAAALKLGRVEAARGAHVEERRRGQIWDSAVPTDAVGPAFVWELESSFKRHADAPQSTAVQEELHRLEATPMTLRSHQVNDLVEALSIRLVSSQSRDAFADDVLGIRRMV